MCLIQLNQTVNAQLHALDDNADLKWNKKIYHLADEANPHSAGIYDGHGGALRYMPDDLKKVRHYIMGRHRIFVTGSHRNCYYQAWMIKDFKKDGRLVEGTEPFNRLLRKALNDATVLTIDPETFEIVPRVIEE